MSGYDVTSGSTEQQQEQQQYSQSNDEESYHIFSYHGETRNLFIR